MAKRHCIVAVYFLFTGLFLLGQENKLSILKGDQFFETDTLGFSKEANQVPVVLYHDLKTETGSPDYMTVKVKYFPASIQNQFQLKKSVKPSPPLLFSNTFKIPHNSKKFYIAYIGQAPKPDFPPGSKITFFQKCCPEHKVEFFLTTQDQPLTSPPPPQCKPGKIILRDNDGHFFSGELSYGTIPLDKTKEFLLFSLSSEEMNTCEVDIDIDSEHIRLKNDYKKITFTHDVFHSILGQIQPPVYSEGSKGQSIYVEDKVTIYLKGKEVESFSITYTLKKPFSGEIILFVIIILVVVGVLGYLAWQRYAGLLKPKNNKTKKTFADRFLLDHIQNSFKKQPDRKIHQIVDWTLQSISSGDGANPGQRYSEFLSKVGFSPKEAQAYRRKVLDNLKYISDDISQDEKDLLSAYVSVSEENYEGILNYLGKKNSTRISENSILKIIKNHDSESIWYYVYFFAGPERMRQSEKPIKFYHSGTFASQVKENIPIPSNNDTLPQEGKAITELDLNYLYEDKIEELRIENKRLESENFSLENEILTLRKENLSLKEELKGLKAISPTELKESPNTEESRIAIDFQTQQIVQNIIFSFQSLGDKLDRQKIKQKGLSNIIHALHQTLHEAHEWLEPLKNYLSQGYATHPTLRKHIESKSEEPFRGVVEYAMSQLFPYISSIGIHLDELAHASYFLNLDGNQIGEISQFARAERENFLRKIEEGLSIQFLPIPLFSKFQRDWKKAEWVKEIQANIPEYYPSPRRESFPSDFVYFIQSLGYMDLEGHVREKTEIVVHT